MHLDNTNIRMHLDNTNTHMHLDNTNTHIWTIRIYLQYKHS